MANVGGIVVRGNDGSIRSAFAALNVGNNAPTGKPPVKLSTEEKLKNRPRKIFIVDGKEREFIMTEDGTKIDRRVKYQRDIAPEVDGSHVKGTSGDDLPKYLPNGDPDQRCKYFKNYFAGLNEMQIKIATAVMLLQRHGFTVNAPENTEETSEATENAAE